MAHLQVWGLSPDQARPGFKAYLTSLETSCHPLEEEVINMLTIVVVGQIDVRPVQPLPNAQAAWPRLPCSATVHARATEHITWEEMCTCMVHIAAARARSTAGLRSLALRFLAALVRSCDGCRAPNVLKLLAHMRTLLPQLIVAAEAAFAAPKFNGRAAPSLSNDWMYAFMAVVSSLANAARCALCPNAALQNVLLGMIEDRGDEEFSEGPGPPRKLFECAALRCLRGDCSCRQDVVCACAGLMCRLVRGCQCCKCAPVFDPVSHL